MEINVRKEFKKEGVPTNQTRNQRLIRNLIYLTHAQPNISQYVSLLSQFTSDPIEDHMNGVISFLRFLKMTPRTDLIFKKNSKKKLKLYAKC